MNIIFEGIWLSSICIACDITDDAVPNESANMDEATLHRVSKYMLKWVTLCLQQCLGHIQHTL